MSNEENNSAVTEAEEIISNALVSLNGNGEDCPLGDDCSVHHRVDEVTVIENERYCRLISYVGDFVVVTDDNPDLFTIDTLIRLAMGQVRQSDIPDLYETSVIRVDDKAIADLRLLSTQEMEDRVVFRLKHGEWDKIREVHDSVIKDTSDGKFNKEK